MRPHRLTAAALAGAALLTSRPAAAQDAAKLSVHGYLTQAYATTDSMQTMGIGSDGTTDYRRAALLLRYNGSAKDNFVLQVAHRRLGDSPVMQYESDVKLDWGFYERRFGTGTSLRVGKAPIPLGIYNETRYVGSLLPLYRAPYSFYFEGAFTSETVDGITVSQQLFAETSWGVELAGYGGNYRLLEFGTVPAPDGTPQYGVGQSKVKNAVGGQLWLSTPLSGLRVGGGASRSTSEGGLLRAPGTKETSTGWHAGVDGRFDRVLARAEYRTFDYNIADYAGYYAQLGAQVVNGLWVHGQVEGIDLQLEAFPPMIPAAMDIEFNRDYGIGLSYSVNPQLVLKIEGHQANGYNFEQMFDFTGSKPKGRYLITSLSTSF